MSGVSVNVVDGWKVRRAQMNAADISLLVFTPLWVDIASCMETVVGISVCVCVFSLVYICD